MKTSGIPAALRVAVDAGGGDGSAELDQGGLPVLLDAVKETFDPERRARRGVLQRAGFEVEERGVRAHGYPRSGGHPATGRMVEKLATPAGRAAYAERKWLSEAPNGKHVLGFRRPWTGEGAGRLVCRR